MPIELIWIVGVVTAGSCIVGSAIYSEAKHYRRMLAEAGRDRARLQ